MIYVMSDIHGCFDKYKEMLEKIKLCSKDTLYVLGDVIDRGEDGIKILLDMMKRANIVPLLGNHEYMAYTVLKRLNVEITDDNFDTQLDQKTMRSWQEWMANGGQSTQEQFTTLNYQQRERVLEYLREFSVYEELCVSGVDYILVHAGLGNFSENKALDDYSLWELVWSRADYGKKYFEDKILITGHTPTALIDESFSGRIYKKNNHIAIDCGVVFGKKLGCICLDTSEEFYV